jgi:hypothetical protein
MRNRKLESFGESVINDNVDGRTKHLMLLLEQVLDDATSDVSQEHKRVWPIRARLYREIAAAIDFRYDTERAMLDNNSLPKPPV